MPESRLEGWTRIEEGLTGGGASKSRWSFEALGGRQTEKRAKGCWRSAIEGEGLCLGRGGGREKEGEETNGRRVAKEPKELRFLGAANYSRVNSSSTPTWLGPRNVLCSLGAGGERIGDEGGNL